MTTNFLEYGIKEGYLYETLATTFSKNKEEIIPNTSCMGIRIKDKETISIIPYPNTTTYKNLKETGLICINFVENVYLYALAALKGYFLSEEFRIFPNKYYDYYNLKRENKPYTRKFPFIKQAWLIIVCELINELHFIKKDEFGEVKLSEFMLRRLVSYKLKESYKFFNRAENLTLETIILTTRLKTAFETKKEFLITKYQKRIEETIKTIKRFGKNQDALKSVELIENYIQNLR